MLQEYSGSSNNLTPADVSTTPNYSSKSLKILIAEDESDIALIYRKVLEKRNHQVAITTNGEDCLKVYHDDYNSHRFAVEQSSSHSSGFIRMDKCPFDVLILDCNMPYINGIEVAKEILAVNPHQRIIFASAYVKDTVIDLIKNLKQVKECIQKPFVMQKLIDLIEDKRIYEELQKLNVDLEVIRTANPNHEQILDLLKRLQDISNISRDE